MRKILIVIGLISVAFGVWYLISTWQTVRVNARTAKLNMDIDNLFVGLQQYKEHVGSYPTGNNAQIVKALKGQNPKNVIILVGRKNEVNDKGEYVDPWGTPLRVYFWGDGVLVRSAGPNKRFDDSSALGCDDYYRSN